VPERLHAALGSGTRVAAAEAGGVALAFTIGENRDGRADWARQLQLTAEQAQGAQLLAARVAARIAPGTQVAFGLREGAGGLTAQLQGASQPAFLIARDAAGDDGFVKTSTASFALHRQFGSLGLTASAESGELWRGDNRTPAELLPGGPRARYPVSSFALAADRRVGPVDAVLGASWLAEDASVLGALFSPNFGMGGADTLFLDASAGLDLASGWHLGAAWRQGWTHARVAGLVAPGSNFSSNAWSVDLSRAGALTPGDSLGIRLSQPLRVNSGGIGLTLPVSYDYTTLLPGYGTRFLALSPSGREFDAELAWRGPVWGGDASASVFYRREPGHYASLPDDKGVALRWQRSF
jgi:hypothetical protein